jgi:predicted flap endonuclease-1-like 5' DNA nuclease
MTKRDDAAQGVDRQANANPIGAARTVAQPDNMAKLRGIGAAVARDYDELYQQRPRGEAVTEDWTKG